MNDRELLELAAKAAGISGIYAVNGYQKTHGIRQADDSLWNPLTDDGDALRLAIKLNIEIGCSLNNAWRARHWVSSLVFTESAERLDGRQDAGEAVRKAIVRAAAEIGSTEPIHNERKCFEAITGHPERVRYGTRQEHSIWSKTNGRRE